MKIEKYEKYGSGKYRLYLDNGEVVETYDSVILKLDLLLKKELDNLDYQKVFSETILEEYYYACQKYIGIRVRSIKEIKDYLLKKKAEVEDIDVVVDRLLKNGYLDDFYFTECFIKDKLRFTTMGKYGIIAELRKNKISDEIINTYIDLMNDDVMLDRIVKLIEKKLRTLKKMDKYKVRNQLYNQLIRLGYPSNLVVSQLNIYFC